MAPRPAAYLYPENRRPCPGVRGGAPGDPRDMAKVGLPETQPPEDASSHPPERHLKPAPVPAAGSGLRTKSFLLFRRCLGEAGGMRMAGVPVPAVGPAEFTGPGFGLPAVTGPVAVTG